MATNRLDALDPAIRRRAAGVYEFQRPSDAQRASLFGKLLPDVKLNDLQMAELVAVTGEREYGYGFSYSDIVQRLVPDALLIAFAANQSLNAEILLQAARSMQAAPPFS
jgi:AAA+ superfamily predicted ATPase